METARCCLWGNFVEGDKEKKKNKRDNQIRTVKKDVFELEAEGIVTITEMDEEER